MDENDQIDDSTSYKKKVEKMLTLERSWILLDHLNDKANRMAEDVWSDNDINSAVLYQTECIRNYFFKLEDSQKQSIQYWIRHDDEFLDYVECLLGEEFTKSLL